MATTLLTEQAYNAYLDLSNYKDALIDAWFDPLLNPVCLQIVAETDFYI
jgi:hypothetical protein